ncbi:MAG TPA: ABC transporter ATP-binding protein [Clostridiales bacterium]|nr:ABC transporter ATP-binding protein [Clostridiales bacterium]
MARNKYDIDESLETPFDLSHLKRSLVYIKRYSKQMIAAFLLSVMASIISLLGPELTQKAIDIAIPNKDVSYLIWLSALIAGTIIISSLLGMVRGLIMAKVGQNIVYDIRSDLFEHLQKLPLAYYDSRPHGKILVRVVQYVNNVSDMLSNGIVDIIIELLNIIFISIFMFRMSPKLALVIVSGLPILVVIVFIIKPKQRKAWQQVSNKTSNLTAYICENIEGVKVTELFNRQEENKKIYKRLNQLLNKVWMKAIYVSNLVWFAVENISQWVIAIMYIVGIIFTAPAVSVGVVVAMGTYASRFWQPITNLANLYNRLINTIAYLERIFQTLDEPIDICDAPDAYDLPAINGDVEFKNVSFEYEPGIRVLNNVSFKVKAGQSVALVGPTGAGKTTIVNLLSRFYNVTEGQILVDGHDISKVTLKSLRSQMGIMLQDTFIFSGTIEDNIRYGRLNADFSEIEEAAKTVKAHDFIVETENGYQTQVNERGGRLSQGQKQLISFARTLLADPKILVLDEATSSIDAKTEQLLQLGINQLLKGRTSFIIAHRLSTIKKCDIIMFIDDGRIVESGTHEELMGKKGRYYELYTAQYDDNAVVKAVNA